MADALFGRRRSIDVGGLALNLKDENHGHGWGGWDEKDKGDTSYAEKLIDVRAHTESVTHLEPVPELSFTELDDFTRMRLVESLGSWTFEPQKLPDEEVLACTYILFEALYRIEGMNDELDIPLGKVAVLLYHFRKVYREGNTYHNFRHALDVLQATYFFLYSAGLVPSVSILLDSEYRTWIRGTERPPDTLMHCLTNKDLFALLIAAVGHDVGHPGLSNAFMKNANTPLSVVYEHKSPLEQMHANLILHLMRNHGLAAKLDKPCPSCRKVLMGSVLATDLRIHNQFMDDFRAMLVDGTSDAYDAQLQRRILLCQAIIKCADISNPGRPYTVSQHWVAALELEWSSQLLLEKHLRLPESVKPSGDPLSEARGQVWFINAFVLPLFELIAEGIHAMEPFAQQCRENLATWQSRCDELAQASNALPTAPLPHPQPETASHLIASFLSAFPPTLPESFRTTDEQFDPAYAFPASPIPPPAQRSVAPYEREPHEHEASSDSGSSYYHSCDSAPSSPMSSPPLYPRMPAEPPHLTISPPAVSPGLCSLSAPSPTPSTAISTMSADPGATEAIRAAYNASVRKKKSFHRSSWNPAPRRDGDPSLRPHGFGESKVGTPVSTSAKTPVSISTNGEEV